MLEKHVKNDQYAHSDIVRELDLAEEKMKRFVLTVLLVGLLLSGCHYLPDEATPESPVQMVSLKAVDQSENPLEIKKVIFEGGVFSLTNFFGEREVFVPSEEFGFWRVKSVEVTKKGCVFNALDITDPSNFIALMICP